MVVYILKSTFCLVLLLGIYHLFLEKEKMHRFNRFYLLGSILFSFLVPSFIITVAPTIIETPIFTEANTFQQIPIDAIPQEQVYETIDYTQYILGIYILISTILFILLSKKVFTLLNKVKQNQHINYFTATVVLLKERIVPYTFLHYIFINKHTYQTDSVEEQILTHELAHVEQKHSIDVLFIEVLQNLFWFNPIFRYYKKAIQLNHEFLADDAVINSHKNITEYQQVLLNTTAQNNNIYLASNLNYSLTKKRLLMMTTPSSKTKILLKKLLVAPLVAGFIFAFAQREEAQEKTEIIETIEEQVSTPKGEKVKTGFKDLNNNNHYFVTINKNTKYYNKEGKLTDNTGKIISTKKANASDIIPGSYITKTYFNGKVFCEFIDNKPNERIINAIDNSKKIKYQKGISEVEMDEYRGLISKAKNARVFMYKQLTRMKELYKKMSTKQQNSVVDVYKLAPDLPPFSRNKKTPTKAQFNSWKNKEKFALWIDNKVVDNSVLNNYKNTDFPYFSGSYVYKNARKGKFPQEYQFHLYTHASFNKMKEREAQDKKNTITIFINKKGGLLVNGKVTTKQKLKDVLSNIDIDRNNAFVVLNGDKNTKMSDVTDVKKILRDCKLYKISINGKLLPPPPPRKHKKTIHVGHSYKKPQVIEVKERSHQASLNKRYNNETYNFLNKSYEKLRNEKPHFIKSSKQRQQNLIFLCSKLGSVYFKLSKADKRKVKRPVYPHYPYIRLKKNDLVYYKLKNDLTKEDRLFMKPPPPPPNASKKELKKFKASMSAWRKRTGQKPQVREINPVKIEVIKNKKGLVEVIEAPDWKNAKKKLEEYKKKHNIIDLDQVVEVEETTEVKELVEVRELKEVEEMPEVVELLELKETQVVNKKHQKLVTIDEINKLTNEEIIELEETQNSDLKKIYYINNKKISKKKFKRLKSKQIKKLFIKKGIDNTSHIYITLKK